MNILFYNIDLHQNTGRAKEEKWKMNLTAHEREKKQWTRDHSLYSKRQTGCHLYNYNDRESGGCHKKLKTFKQIHLMWRELIETRTEEIIQTRRWIYWNNCTSGGTTTPYSMVNEKIPRTVQQSKSLPLI